MTKTERRLHKIDASGKAVGRLASEIAVILRGKNKPEFEPRLDNGDIVEVANIDKLKFTGKKLDQKNYFRYSGYPGGLRTESMKKLRQSRPDGAAEILKRAVREMLPPVKFRGAMLKRLIVK